MSALPAILGAGVTPTELATEPESVRRGGEAAQQAYETGLGFQSMLVSQLTQQLTSTISGDSASSDSDGLGGTDSSDGADGSGSSALGGYSSLLTSALTQGVSSGDETGVAMQIARSIDPKLGFGPS